MNYGEFKKELDKPIPWYRTIYYWLYRRWYWISERPRLTKDFWQRGRKGYAHSDTWGLDGYILSWLPEAIRELAEAQNSYPGSGEKGAETLEAWHETLMTMATKLECGRKMDEIDLEDYKIGYGPKPYDWEAYKAEEERLHKEWEEGMDLFKKWFFHLWD